MYSQVVIDNQHFFYYLFNLTAGTLYALSLITHLSYQWWNIVIWFGLIPASWIFLISRKTTGWLNLLSVVLFLYMFNTATWVKWFNQAVELLYKIGGCISSDYKLTSVYICVFLPIIIYALLFLIFTSRKSIFLFSFLLSVLVVFVIAFFPISNAIIRGHHGYFGHLVMAYRGYLNI